MNDTGKTREIVREEISKSGVAPPPPPPPPPSADTGDITIKKRTLTVLRVSVPVLITACVGFAGAALDARSKIDNALREAAAIKSAHVEHLEKSERRFEKLEDHSDRDRREIGQALTSINARLAGLEAKLDLLTPRVRR